MDVIFLVVIRGQVQGVGFRAWAELTALELGVEGWIRNCRDGSIEALLSGSEEVVLTMIELCRDGPPGARVDASDTSGSITVQGATVDVKAHSVSGNVTVRGNLSPSSYWDLRSISGNAEIGVPANSNFHLLAESTSGEIRADIPIMIEEQGKHSLRAQIGTGGGRVEAHSISGEIHLTPSN